MTLADDVNLEEFVMTKDDLSGADVKAICTGLYSPSPSPLLSPLPPLLSPLLSSPFPPHTFNSEAGLLALRERRMKVTHVDFKKAKEKVLYRKSLGVPEGLYL